MGEDPFDRLLDAMPKIAEAVNAFSSLEVQRQAFDALLRAHGRVDVNSVTPDADVPPAMEPSTDAQSETRTRSQSTTRKKTPSPSKKAASTAPTARGRTVTTWTPNRNLNVRPEGKQSLMDFVTEKNPRNGLEKNLVVVYWLQEILGKEAIDPSDVMAGYRACSWPVPSDLPNGLSVTGSKKGWLDTKSRKDIKLTLAGENTS